MSGATLEITYRDAEVQALARRLGRTLGQPDTQSLMQAIGEVVLSRTMLRFERGMGPGGARWQKSLAALREGRQTLIKSGYLRDSINAAGPQVAATSVEVGTNVPYASVHQEGAVIPPHVVKARRGKALRIPGIGFRRQVNHPGGEIPARPFLGIDAEDERAILDITDTWIKQTLGRLQ